MLDGVYIWLQLLLSLVGHFLRCGDLLAHIFLLLYERQHSELCITC